MKMLRFIFVAVCTVAMFGCGNGRDNKNVSRGTGWNINSREGGFQYNADFTEQPTGPGLVFVEGGTYTMGRVKDDPMHDWNNSPNQQHVQSFYLDETEVTNVMYLEMLDYLKRVYPIDDERYSNIYTGMLPDTLVWRNSLGFNETMTTYYLRHPAFANYPVVGVSWIQAVEYADWRTDRVNEVMLEKEGYTSRNAKITGVTPESAFNTYTYIQAPTEVYGGNDSIIRGGRKSKQIDSQIARSADTLNSGINSYAQVKDGVMLPNYRLPTEAEWEYAALGLGSLRDYNLYRGRKKYPWDGKYTRDGRKRTRGDQKANFKQGDGDYGGIAGWSDDGADITNEVKSYEPNDFGLYDMAGNVSEWVADVYRPIVDDEFNDFNYFRGNVYTKNAIGEDGKVTLITTDSIVNDTLSDGKVIVRNLPGEISQVPVDENETYLRQNFQRSDNRDFRDGDRQSSRYFQQFEDEEMPLSKRMYNAPVHTVEADTTGELIREYDKNNRRTTLVNNEIRVIKGGSWRDRAYWLDPSQRRFFPQDRASDDIGFRCAMSRVGSKAKKSSRKKRG